MKDLTRIEPEPEIWTEIGDHELEWLSKSKNHGLEHPGLTTLVRLLIHKVNELTSEVNRMKADNK